MTAAPIQPPSGGRSQVRSVEAARPGDGPETGKPTAKEARDRLNVEILDASLQVSLRSGDQSLALLYRSAIDRINEVLAPELGPNAVENAAGDDHSPEATAERILSFSTAFFDAYSAAHPGKDGEQLARDFVDLIRQGFEQGFNEAKDILQGLGVLGGEVETGIMKTYELVHRGLDDFLESRLAPAGE